jgi:cell pole-organizing protein PopZ
MPQSRHAEDVLELTQMVTDDGSVVDVTKADHLQQSPSPPPRVEPREEPRPEPRPEPRMENNELLSANTASAASQSFAGLAGAVSSSRGVPLGGGQRTIEELVKEMLRPMLKQWLDANLPGLVQRIVEREVAKLAGRAEDSSRR